MRTTLIVIAFFFLLFIVYSYTKRFVFGWREEMKENTLEDESIELNNKKEVLSKRLIEEEKQAKKKQKQRNKIRKETQNVKK